MIEICCPRGKDTRVLFQLDKSVPLQVLQGYLLYLPEDLRAHWLVPVYSNRQLHPCLHYLDKRVPLAQACGGLEGNRVKSFPTSLHRHAEAVAGPEG